MLTEEIGLWSIYYLLLFSLQLKLKISICVIKHTLKTHSFVALQVRHSLFYNVQFPFRLVILTEKLFNHTKLKLKFLKANWELLENLNFNLFSHVIFPLLPGQSGHLRWPIFNKLFTPGSQGHWLTPGWKKKTLSEYQILFEELSLKLLCNVICTSLPSQSHTICFIIVKFGWIATPGCQTFQILLCLTKKPLSTSGGLSKKS